MKLQKTKSPSQKNGYEINLNKKKYNRFSSLSSRVSENMGLLVNSMSQICEAMIHSSSNSDFKAIHYLSKSGLNTSNNLKKSIKLYFNIIDNYEDEDYLEKDVYTPKYLKEIKEGKKTKNRNIKKKEKENEKEDFNFDLTKKAFGKNKKAYNSLFKYRRKYNKLKKLNKLKAEIIMGEQRKKYSLTKKFEEPSNTERLTFNRTTNEKFDHIDSKSKYMDIYTKNPNEKSKDNSLNILSLSLKNGNPTKIYNNDNNTSKSKEKRINSAFKRNTNNINTSLKKQNSEIFQNTQVSTTVNTTINNSIISNNKNNTSISFRLRPYSAASFRTRTTTQSNHNKTKQLYNKKIRENILNYIKSVQFDANKESSLLYQNYEYDNKVNKNLDKKRKIKNFFEKKEDHFDVNKINQEFGFETNKKNDNINRILIDEEEIEHKYSERVSHYLNEQGKRILNDIIKKIKYDEKRLNKNYLIQSLYEKRLIRLKMDDEFKLVAHESLALEKELEEKFNDENDSIDRVQHKEILNIIHDIIQKEWNDIDNLKEHILRCKVMKKIQLYEYKKNPKPKTCREFKFKDKFDEEKIHFNTYGNKKQNNNHNHSHNDTCNRKHCNH